VRKLRQLFIFNDEKRRRAIAQETDSVPKPKEPDDPLKAPTDSDSHETPTDSDTVEPTNNDTTQTTR
jgi:hypothetical protein